MLVSIEARPQNISPSPANDRPPVAFGVEVYNLGKAIAEQVEVQFSIVSANGRPFQIGLGIIACIEGGRQETI